MNVQRTPDGKPTGGMSGDPMLGMLGIPITRRSLLQGGLVAATGFWLTDRLGAPVHAQEQPAA